MQLKQCEFLPFAHCAPHCFNCKTKGNIMSLNILHFKDKSRLLNALNDHESFKRNKAGLLQGQIPPKPYKPTLCGDLTKESLYIIPMEHNPYLYIIDCDNLYTASLFLANMPETFTTRSPFGAKLYYIINPSADLTQFNHFHPVVDKDFTDAVEYATQSHQINFEIFHKSKLIFDGADSPYYYIDNPAPIRTINNLAQDLPFLYNLLQGAKQQDKTSDTSPAPHETAPITPRANKDKADFVRDCLKTNTINLYAFKALFHNIADKYLTSKNNLAKGNRNNFLNALYTSSIASALLNADEINDFISLANSQFCNPPILQTELAQTILRPHRTEQVLKTTQKQPQAVYTQESQESPHGVFLAINFFAKHTNERYLFCNFDDPYAYHILYMADVKQITQFARLYPQLNEYLIIENKKLQIADEKLITLQIDIATPHPTQAFTKMPNGAWIFHANFYSINPRLFADAKPPTRPFDELKVGKVLSQNLFPHRPTLIKWLCDAYHNAITGEPIQTMCTIYDEGSTGKSSILVPFYQALRYYHTNKAPMQGDNVCISAKDIYPTTIKASTIVESRFNAYADSNSLFIEEDGDSQLRANDLFTRLQDLVKSEYIAIERKGKDPYTKKNCAFVTRFTNNIANALPNNRITNTRFYCSYGLQQISPQELKQLFTIDKNYSFEWNVKQVIQNELDDLIAHIRLWYHSDEYIGYSNIPESHEPDDLIEYETLTDDLANPNTSGLTKLSTIFDYYFNGTQIKQTAIESAPNAPFTQFLQFLSQNRPSDYDIPLPYKRSMRVKDLITALCKDFQITLNGRERKLARAIIARALVQTRSASPDSYIQYCGKRLQSAQTPPYSAQSPAQTLKSEVQMGATANPAQKAPQKPLHRHTDAELKEIAKAHAIDISALKSRQAIINHFKKELKLE